MQKKGLPFLSGAHSLGVKKRMNWIWKSRGVMKRWCCEVSALLCAHCQENSPRRWKLWSNLRKCLAEGGWEDENKSRQLARTPPPVNPGGWRLHFSSARSCRIFISIRRLCNVLIFARNWISFLRRKTKKVAAKLGLWKFLFRHEICSKHGRLGNKSWMHLHDNYGNRMDTQSFNITTDSRQEQKEKNKISLQQFSGK